MIILVIYYNINNFYTNENLRDLVFVRFEIKHVLEMFFTFVMYPLI